MPEYSASDIQIEMDYVSLIRRTFGPTTRTAQELIGNLVRNLVLTKSLPLRVDLIDGWWTGSSEIDWLVETDGCITFRSFTYVVHFPLAGREACRSEILLTAFADAVVTRGEDAELEWFAGDAVRWTLPDRVEDMLRNIAVALWLSGWYPSNRWRSARKVRAIHHRSANAVDCQKRSQNQTHLGPLRPSKNATTPWRNLRTPAAASQS
jgi:hypothetical protein